MLEIYNNLTRKKEPFTPIDPNNVRMYVCGMTVYDLCHLGHARVLVVFDVVSRYLRKIYGVDRVTYVRNITDIDDKIIQRANENKEEFSALTGRFIEEMNQDADTLGVQRPDAEPRATTHMGQIIDMIQSLIDKGNAYQANVEGGGGDVYYDVSGFENYGELSGKKLEDLRAGARVEVEEAKDDPLDFVLWKTAKPDEPSWDSPWGKGRPGWHIECSAMSTHCLGNHFDIHGGGMDLQFPHHENEIAQSEAATGEKFVNVWMHNGFVRIDDEKMSKSLGNFFTVREILTRYKPEVIRYFVLSSHYRSPLNYSDAQLDSARAALDGFYAAMRGLSASVSDKGDKDTEHFYQAFYKVMDDDFNTSEAISVLASVRHELNRVKSAGDIETATKLAGVLRSLGNLLGLLQDDPEHYLQGLEVSDDGLNKEQIEQMIVQRLEARKNKDFAGSDRIRDELKAQGIVLEDGAGGTTWRRE
ncbi:MAG: cysteine--tRNA ligase [Gammaproteobacteria bacterium]|nr:cysteine--tRNA ligase [Gammaproteobacteria bacterium]